MTRRSKRHSRRGLVRFGPWRPPSGAREAQRRRPFDGQIDGLRRFGRNPIAEASQRAVSGQLGADCPGIGPITSSVLAATLPDATGFKTARDLAASC